MSDQRKKSDHDPLEELELPSILESPPQQEITGTRGGLELFDDQTIGIMASKLAVHESLLALLTRDYTFQEFMREVLLTVIRVVKSEAGSLLELDYSRRVLFFRAVVGQSSDRLDAFTVPFGQGIVGYVAESRQPLVVDDVAENQVYLKSIQDAVGFEARNLVAVPILIRGRAFAVLELLNRVGEKTYTAEDVDLLTYLAQTIAKAVELRLMLSWGKKTNSSGEAA